VFDRFFARRLALPATAAVLVLLLAVLATLQYRWLGQVAEAERARLQAGARVRVEQIADEFDREITRAYAWLRVDPEMLGEGGGERFAARYERWSARTEHPGLVAAIYVAEHAEGAARLRRFDPAARALVDAPWPDELAPLKAALEGGPGERVGPRPPFGLLAGDVPALVIPIVDRTGDGRGGPRPPVRPRAATIVVLDRAYMAGEMLPALVTRHVASGGARDYAVVVRSRHDPAVVVYRSDAPGEDRRPEATASLLEVRFDQVESGVLRAGDPAAPAPFARRGPPRDGRRPPPPGEERGPGPRGRPDHGLWEASIVHRGGSLDDVVASVRRRNLAISSGILLLLGASVAMIVLSSQRARRLADQQVEFVAGVSHELRTPVAVVCSAGENLADGLVTDPAEVRLYGATVRDEGRRLAEMVEQVLEFAGIESASRVRAREAVPLAAVVRDALAASAAVLAESGAEVAVDVPRDLPPVVADAAALRRAVQNLVQNAARHAAAGRWIGISAAASGAGSAARVRLTVRDRGPGIAPADQARLFQPFFRGQKAIAAGIKGSGLGLSLVKRIAESHGGSVEVETAPGAGTAVTLVLPAAAARAAGMEAEEGRAQADPAR
jgi:signal transduction histidine kinase